MITHWLDFTAQSIFDIPSFAEVELYTELTPSDYSIQQKTIERKTMFS